MPRLRNALLMIILPLSILGQRGDAGVDEPMIFYQAMTGGNCLTCRWIATEGVIEADTAKQFLTFLTDEGLIGVPGLNIHLNSPGGDLIGGVLLGDAIRQQKANTVVATAPIKRISKDGLRWVGF